MDTVLRRASCPRTINLDLPAPGIHTSFSLKSLHDFAHNQYLRAGPGPACRSSTHYAHMSAPDDDLEWGDASLTRFPGQSPSKLKLQFACRIAKYKCGICGRPSNRWQESVFYCCKCPFKVCEDCIQNRPSWREHKCPPRRSSARLAAKFC